MNARRWIQDRAVSQHALVTKADLDEGAVPRGVRRGLVADGTLELLGRRVYRLRGAPITDLQRVAVACFDTGGVASHRTSAWLHGIPGFERLGQPEVTLVRSSFTYGLDIARVHTTTNLQSDDVLEVSHIPTLSVARTLFSLASLVPEISAEVVAGAIDGAVAARTATDRWLWWLLERIRCRGRNGVSVFEDLLVARAGGMVTESWLERETLRVFDEAGLPRPVCQQRISRQGAFVARVDFCYPELGIIIEVSGHAWHSTREQRARDARRRRELVLGGHQVLEYTYDDVVSAPALMVAQIVEARALRGSTPRALASS